MVSRLGGLPYLMGRLWSFQSRLHAVPCRGIQEKSVPRFRVILYLIDADTDHNAVNGMNHPLTLSVAWTAAASMLYWICEDGVLIIHSIALYTFTACVRT